MNAPLPHCAICNKTIRPYRFVCPLEDGTLACADCAEKHNLWEQWERSKEARPPALSQPVKWWALINEMEAFRKATGAGMPAVWGHVHGERYEKAVEAFKQVRQALGR